MNATADWLPLSQRLVAERRRHPRALLSLPVRLRWLGPLGLEAESSETLDAGRGGVLVSSRESRAEGSLVWVTFPYDAASSSEPEISAQVARSKTTPSGGYLAGIAFADGNKRVYQSGHYEFSGNASASIIPDGLNRRRTPRNPLALPVRVRGVDALWPDDAMTIDISRNGLQFCTLRVYHLEDVVALALPRSAWLPAGDRRARVARIANHPSERRLLCVGVEFPP